MFKNIKSAALALKYIPGRYFFAYVMVDFLQVPISIFYIFYWRNVLLAFTGGIEFQTLIEWLVEGKRSPLSAETELENRPC